ncbi:MAG: hypothetical protein GY941_25595 [Planctomycetes bacterium]|nr:hypothetical protein [Planctomycetota bacterium]
MDCKYFYPRRKKDFYIINNPRRKKDFVRAEIEFIPRQIKNLFIFSSLLISMAKNRNSDLYGDSNNNGNQGILADGENDDLSINKNIGPGGDGKDV